MRSVPDKLSPTTRMSAVIDPPTRFLRAIWVKVPFALTSKAAAGSRTDLKKAAMTSSGASGEGLGLAVGPVAAGPAGRMTSATTIRRPMAAARPPSSQRDRGDCGMRTDPTATRTRSWRVARPAWPGDAAAPAGAPGPAGAVVPVEAGALADPGVLEDADAKGVGANAGRLPRPKRPLRTGPSADSTVLPAASRQ